jgi:hypothetical protein
MPKDIGTSMMLTLTLTLHCVQHDCFSTV